MQRRHRTASIMKRRVFTTTLVTCAGAALTAGCAGGREPDAPVATASEAVVPRMVVGAPVGLASKRHSATIATLRKVLKPPRLMKGDKVGLVAVAGPLRRNQLGRAGTVLAAITSQALG